MMVSLIHELLTASAARRPDARALTYRKSHLDYGTVASAAESFAKAALASGLARQERVAVYLPKRPETVATIFGATMAGGVFVPVNPLLKPPQVGHILRDCAVRVLVTTAQRLAELTDELARCPELRLLVVLDGAAAEPRLAGKTVVGWDDFLAAGSRARRTASSTPTWPRSSTPRAAPGSRRAWCSRTRTWSPAPRASRSTSRTARTTGCWPCCRSASTTASASSRPRSTWARASC